MKLKRTRLLNKPLIGFSSARLILILLVLFVTILIVQTSTVQVRADDDESKSISNSLAWASVGLFVISSIYILFYQTFCITRNFSDEGNFSKLKNNYRIFFLKIRKPFLYIHYMAGFFALVTLLTHGILLTSGDEEPVAVGWATGAIYIFYILTGLILWLKIKPFWK